MTIKDTLIAARKKIERPENWIKDGVYARDAKGKVVRTRSIDAYAYCIEGSILAVTAGIFDDKNIAARDFLMKYTRGRALPVFNDAKKRTHAEVLALFDKAIAEAE
jgi:hypothetical protein